MTTLQKAAVGVTAAYGLIALTGGLIGYVKADSLASLIAGGGSGVLLLISAAIARQKPKGGLTTALIISVILVGRFVKASFTGDGGVSTVAAVMIAGGLAVVVTAALALRELSQSAR
jgi:uncharacterized membrane protein (UPF0136 family)